MAEYTEIIGIFAGSFTTVAYLPQLIKVVQTRSTDDISVWMYLILCSGLAMWVVYGFMIWSVSLIAANMVTLCLAFAILRVKLQNIRIQKSTNG